MRRTVVLKVFVTVSGQYMANVSLAIVVTKLQAW